MGTHGRLLWWAHIALFWVSFTWQAVHAKVTPFLPQSFYFNWNLASQPVPIPVTAQCDTIHITWGRSTATGPNPTAPYVLQIYTSTFIYPFIIPAGSGLSFDWAVPFAPGTQYQICMFDTNGNTGGCQAVYTVIPPLNTTAAPSCTNVTFPTGPLNVNGVVDNGPLSQFGWVDQCTDISVTPVNGTPPYIFTIAPALHPPYNITINGMSATNWTVSLTWASPFFISVVDSLGNSWANGPLHSGENGPTGCLTGAVDAGSPKKKVPTTTIGAGVGGIVVGLVAGIVAAYFFMRRRHKREADTLMDLGSGSPMGSPHSVAFDRALSGASSHYRAVPSNPLSGQLIDGPPGSPPARSMPLNRMIRSGQYQIEPFTLPEDGRTTAHGAPSTMDATVAPDESQAQSHSSGSQPQQNQVYVVHHDGGRAPVTVYHQDGTEVVELPPRYIDGSVSGSEVRSDGRSDGPSDSRSEGRSDTGRSARHSFTGRSEALTEGSGFLHQPRRPNTLGKPKEGTSFVDPS